MAPAKPFANAGLKDVGQITTKCLLVSILFEWLNGFQQYFLLNVCLRGVGLLFQTEHGVVLLKGVRPAQRSHGMVVVSETLRLCAVELKQEFG